MNDYIFNAVTTSNDQTSIDEFNKDAYFYNPEVTYYFMSWTSESECRWVRSPWLTAEELNGRLEELNSDPDDYKNLCIMTEDLLDAKIYVKDEKNEFIESSLRSLIYGTRYDVPSIKIRNEPGREFGWKRPL